MNPSVDVHLWGNRIGILYQGDDDPVPVFEYDRDFQDSGIELAPFKMPLSDRLYSFPELMASEAFHGMPGLIADSLPDKFGNAVIRRWLSNMGRSPDGMTPLERLYYTGTRGMGALEYIPSDETKATENIEITALTELASEILSERERARYDVDEMTMMQMMEIGSSAGGSRAKAVIAWNQDTGEVRSGQIDPPPGFDQWLIKFDNVRGNGDYGEKDGKQYTLIEYAYYLMAKECGIDMSECHIMEKDGMSHFMTRRFDRAGRKKVFTQTLAALGHYDFNEPGSCSYETYAGYARKLGIGASGVEEIFRRMTFNVLSANCDDHVKNFSFIMDRQGRWSLSPAYDLTFAYNPNNRWLREHQMTVNGKSRGITDEDLIESGRSMGLGTRFCRETIRDVRGVVSEWRFFAGRCGIESSTVDAIGSVIDRSGPRMRAM